MCAHGRRTAASAAWGAGAAVQLLPRLFEGQRGSATAVSAARGQRRQRYCCLGRAAASGDSANALSAVSGTVAVVQGLAVAA